MRLAVWSGQGLFFNPDYVEDARAFAAAIGNNSYNPSTNINILIKPETIVDIYKRLSNMPEGIAARPNKDAKDALLPQLVAMTEGTDTAAAQSAGYVLQTLQAWDAKQINDTDGVINNLVGKLFTS